MKPLVIAATALALVAPAAHAQTATPAPTAEQAAENAADAAENAAQQAEDAADKAADQAGAAAEQAADEAAAAADSAADAAATATDDAATAAGMDSEAADDAAAAAEDAQDSASDAADAAVDAAAETPVTPPDVNAPAISEAEPGLLGSWLTSRRIWTTNQPSSTEWVDPALDQRPAEWQDIAKVNDIVLDDSGNVVGYVADIGGFLGIGAKKVLLGVDAIHLVTVGNDTFFATNYTKEELQALPDFDEKTVRR
ncbi:PRC-barrel domain-containing protein [Paracoccus yeei]|uniref:Uncharacterized protein n=1 Tax=Paracoccus yeei TaxID=147645 RepID=A0A5P2QUZ7_9RHOB|nr:PRC-barrel domain-containing protein [Paracoccus yeei]MBY0137234.1 PRC-barrel domain-containing protein [Paracoccus yeei]QEU09917.1 hypothetical protein FOB51_18975 [Paracoccus yeei]